MVINNYNEIIVELSKHLMDDCMELWVIVDAIKESNPQLNFKELIESTKKVVQDLMQNYKMKLLNEKTWKSMDISLEDTIYFVEDLLLTLNRIPTIGDGYWFTMDEYISMNN